MTYTETYRNVQIHTTYRLGLIGNRMVHAAELHLPDGTVEEAEAFTQGKLITLAHNVIDGFYEDGRIA